MRRSPLVLLGLLMACDDGFARGWELDRLRVLGARVEAESDATRAALRPGERGRVQWLVVGPSSTPALSWAYATCEPPLGDRAEPTCAGDVFATSRGSATDERVVMDVSAPARVGDVLMLVAFCASAPPELDPRTFQARCADGEPLLASTTLAVGTENRNPELPETALRFESSEWSTLDAPCAELPQATLPGFVSRVTVSPREEDREAVAQGDVETLTFSSFVDQGSLDRQYSVQEPGPLADVELGWRPPYPAWGEQIARFVFVLRDGRGGMAFARRAVCVRTPSAERNQP